MSPRASWILGLAAGVLLLAPAVEGRQRLRVTPAFELSQQFDSNIGYDTKDEESDVITIFTPSVEISYEGDLGHASARAGLRSRSYWDHSDANAVDRFGRADFERLLTPRLAVLGKGSLDFAPNRDAVEDGNGQELIGDRPDTFRQDYSGGFRYALDPLSTVTAIAGFKGVDYNQGDGEDRFYRRDLNSLNASLSYARQLSARDEAGLTLQLSNDRFSEVKGQLGGSGEETNRTVAALLSWGRQWTPAWSTRVSAGARNVQIKDDGIPGLTLNEPSGLDLSPTDTSFGFLGGLELQRQTKRTVMTLGYNKETRPSSGYGSTVDADTVSAGFSVRLSERLRLDAGGFAQQYRSLGDTLAVISRTIPFGFGFVVPATCEPLGYPDSTPGEINGSPVCAGVTNDAIDARVLGGHLQLGWRMNGHWSTFLRYTFRDQTSDGKRPVAEYTDHRVMMGFRYAVPIDLF